MKRNRFSAYYHFLTGIPSYLKNVISIDDARKELASRMSRRNERFLDLVENCIYGNPRSPYLKLLEAAGCEFGDFAGGIREYGLEEHLRRLMKAGVWISSEEFKGTKPVRRGSVDFEITPEDFDNQILKRCVGVSTGGTSGRPVKTKLDLDFLSARSHYDRIMFEILGVRDQPMALWYPSLPASTGIGNILRYARNGIVPKRWFEIPAAGSGMQGLESRLATFLIVRMARMAGTRIPKPVKISSDSGEEIAGQIIQWLDEYGGCIFQSYVSRAVRVARELSEKRDDLDGLLMIVGSEPLTEAKRREMESRGARIYSRYMATEMGTIAMGCGNPETIDELHLMSDMVAAVQEGDVIEGESGPLYFTTLDRVMPKVMLNVQLGDMAVVHSRQCGCLFEELGFSTHLSHVRSHSRYTGEGMALSASRLEEIVADVLVPVHGGSSLDYQLFEMENDDGVTRVEIRVSPRIGAVDEDSLIQDFIDELLKGDEGKQLMARIWMQTGVLSVVRKEPELTGRGKNVPLLHERVKRIK